MAENNKGQAHFWSEAQSREALATVQSICSMYVRDGKPGDKATPETITAFSAEVVEAMPSVGYDT